MSKNNIALLKHIRDAIYRVENYTNQVSLLEFLDDSNDMLRAATVRELEIIGEAANKITHDYKESNTEIPWRDMIDTRNKVIHDYMSVDYELVWGILQEELPNLKLKIEQVVGTN